MSFAYVALFSCHDFATFFRGLAATTLKPELVKKKVQNIIIPESNVVWNAVITGITRALAICMCLITIHVAYICRFISNGYATWVLAKTVFKNARASSNFQANLKQWESKHPCYILPTSSSSQTPVHAVLPFKVTNSHSLLTDEVSLIWCICYLHDSHRTVHHQSCRWGYTNGQGHTFQHNSLSHHHTRGDMLMGQETMALFRNLLLSAIHSEQQQLRFY